MSTSRWLADTLGADLRAGSEEVLEVAFTEPLTIEEFEQLRDNAPDDLEVLAGSTVWIDDQERINGLLIGDQGSNEVIVFTCPPNGDEWAELGAMPEAEARESLRAEVDTWDPDGY